MKTIYLLALSLFLVGCSASGPRYQPSHVTSQGNGKIYIYRPSQFVNGGGFPQILINNRTVGPLKNGGYLQAEVPAGQHLVTSKGNVMHWFLRDQNVSVNIRPGEVVYLRLLSSASAASMVGAVGINMERQSNLHHVWPDYAQQEIRSTKLSR